MRARDKIVLEEIQIEPGRKQEILQNLRQAAAEKRSIYCPSLWEIFRGQLKYISGFCLGGQGVCLLLLIFIFSYFQRTSQDMMTYLGTGSVTASFIGIFFILELSRNRDYGMTELEQTCYLNLKQIWCVKMILFGCMDLLVFTIMILGIAGNTSWGIFQIMIYLLVPFVWSNGIQLFVFTMLRGGKKEYLQIGTVLLTSILWLYPLSHPRWYTITYFGIWLIALAVAAAFWIREILRVWHKLGEGEMVCWN
ncbi:MAG: hypothetical protein HFH41_09925 [Lachnospiraceae bacterium]|nr:hypothetical protein [Lachnospiraceae bacterium]